MKNDKLTQPEKNKLLYYNIKVMDQLAKRKTNEENRTTDMYLDSINAKLQMLEMN